MLQEGEIVIQMTISPDSATTRCCLFILTNLGNIYYKVLIAKEVSTWYKLELPK